MKTKTFLFGFVSISIVGLVVGVFLGLSSNSYDESSRPIVGNVRTFEAAYGRWKADAERNGQRTKLVLSLGHFKGLSSEFSQAHGKALLDLGDGSLSVEVAGLPAQRNFDIWLIDNRPGPGRSVKPESGDRMIRAGALTRQGDNATLVTDLDREALADFKLDLMAVVPEGRRPIDGGLLYASPNVFQKLYYSESPAQRLVSTRLGDPGDSKIATSSLLAPFRSLVPTLAYAADSDNARLVGLIATGEKLFFEEKFQGNSRTCGTCHPADNNLTIDPTYIATLPKNDPLFVADFKRELNSDQNGGRFFEVPVLMRQSGLILENVDGFDDLANKFVLRGVPHLLSLGLSINTAAGFDGTSPELPGTGWDGGGAFGTNGTLKAFALGAVFQHFTRTLDRVPGVDFRFPTDDELDAIEAFLLSLGRHSELDLTTLTFKDFNLIDGEGNAATKGRDLFIGTGKCSLCHFNAGANQSLSIPPGNANFNIGVEAAAGRFPRDGGFGTAGTLSTGFGDGTFNTPSLVEAADSPPFFHNNFVDTIEKAVGFYNLNFNDSPAADLIGPISLNTSDVDQIAAFLRVINALENIRSAQTKLTSALNASNPPRVDKLLDLAIVDVKDAIRVLLTESQLLLYPTARAILANVIAFCDTARKTGNKVKRDASINAALSALGQARGEMVVEP